MAIRFANVTFRVLELLDNTPGIWCDDCMLPSAQRITLASQVEGGPLRISTGNRCFDCGRWF